MQPYLRSTHVDFLVLIGLSVRGDHNLACTPTVTGSLIPSSLHVWIIFRNRVGLHPTREVQYTTEDMHSKPASSPKADSLVAHCI
jgi:hypothetical protein